MIIDYNNPNDMWTNSPIYGMQEPLTKGGCLRMAAMLGFLIAAMVVCLLLSSCSTVKYVPVVEHKTDTMIQTKVQRDSVWLHDSIHVTERGDTVRIERWHTKYIESVRHDTTYISKTDTVPQPYPVEKLVEKPLSKTQRTLMYLGIASLLAGIVAVAWRLKKFIPWA